MAHQKATKSSKPSGGFTAEEREAMKERARELKSAKRGADGEADVQAAIARMPEPDRTLSGRLHELIRAAAPQLLPKTWYGMPAYANADEKIICFFRPASKFKDRYLTLGFNDAARLDDGAMWPTSFALVKLTAAEEKRIRELVKKAIG
ncbi:MAG: iron chaperone [Rhodanobacteraceae bacterium]